MLGEAAHFAAIKKPDALASGHHKSFIRFESYAAFLVFLASGAIRAALASDTSPVSA